MSSVDGIFLSAAAGSGAALASVFAKLAFSDFWDTNSTILGGTKMVSILLRITSFGLMLLCNSVMMTCFTKAMHKSTSFRATVATTSFNFSISVLPYQWWLGFFFIIVGLAMIAKGQVKVSEHAD